METLEKGGSSMPEKGRSRKVMHHDKPLPLLPQQNGRARARSHSDSHSLLVADDHLELRPSRSSDREQEDSSQPYTIGPVREKTEIPQSRWRKFFNRNFGLAMVLVAQMFGTLMNITTRILEVEGNRGEGLHPFQILFARMSITLLLSMLYMWYKQVPDFPFGAKGVRALLVARGMGGFFGVFGLYWSLQYLPLSDATVLTFLGPPLACYACSKLINEPFTRVEQIGGFISLLGVILIARPTYIFSLASSSIPASSSPTNSTTPSAADAVADTIIPRASPDTATDAQRLAAVGMAMLGVLGAACAYTTIRWIGHRAHPLISINYFAVWCTLVSTTALLFVPSIPFTLPQGPKEWTLLFFIGVSGFLMQFLLTAGLRWEKSSRATNMIYSQMMFALVGDQVVFGMVPGWWSVCGSTLILGSAVVVAVQKEGSFKGKGATGAVVGGEENRREENGTGDEEMGLFAVGDEVEEEEDAGEKEGEKERRLDMQEAGAAAGLAGNQAGLDAAQGSEMGAIAVDTAVAAVEVVGDVVHAIKGKDEDDGQ